MKRTIGRPVLLALLATLVASQCHAQDEDWPTDPPPQSSCRDSIVRHYVESKFTGLDVMTRMAHRRYPGSRVRMGGDKLINARMFKGSCFASVPFYFDHPDRLELWAVMLVDAKHEARFISTWAADFLPYQAWQSSSLNNAR